MDFLDARLQEWTESYRRLREAQKQLTALHKELPLKPILIDIQAQEVAMLAQESDAAMRALNLAFSAMKKVQEKEKH